MKKTLMCLALMAATAQAHADTDAAAAKSPEGCKVQSAEGGSTDNLFGCKLGPLQFTAGPVTNGGFGSALKGGDAWYPNKDIFPINNEQTTGLDLSGNAAVAWNVDGSWTTKPSTPSNFTLTVGPEMDFSIWKHYPEKALVGKPLEAPPGHIYIDPDPQHGYKKSLLGFGIRGDLRYRYGNFKSGTTLDKANQFIVGGTATVIEPFLRGSYYVPLAPGVDVSYYKIVDTTGSKGPVPDDVKADFIQVEFHTKLATDLPALGLKRVTDKANPISLDIKYDASKATEGTERGWQNLCSLGLNVEVPGIPFKPAITYQSGKNGGFTYDRQVLIGFAMDLLAAH